MIRAKAGNSLLTDTDSGLDFAASMPSTAGWLWVEISYPERPKRPLDNYEIGVQFLGATPVELTIPRPAPLTCNSETVRLIGKRQLTADSALRRALQARDMLHRPIKEGGCGKTLGAQTDRHFRARLEDLRSELQAARVSFNG